MKRLVLIGNGFDKAHGLATGYNDYLLWLFRSVANELMESGARSIENGHINVAKNIFKPMTAGQQIENLQEVYRCTVPDFGDATLGNAKRAANKVHFWLKSRFMQELLHNAIASDPDWNNIEKSYYNHLKIAVGEPDKPGKKQKVVALNNDLEFIKRNLASYLLTLAPPKPIADYERIVGYGLKSGYSIMLLSFNYTHTHFLYEYNSYVESKVELINIHGDIHDQQRNPLIFGYGDEVDRKYRELQDEDLNCILDNIKSIGYFKTGNHRRLTNFINSNEPFEVVVLGHSLGLSDRTLLHKIFNHPKCQRIYIYYYADSERNNFTELSQEITRHFYDTDFNVMRDRVIEFREEYKMPQFGK